MNGQIKRTDKGLEIKLEAENPTYKQVFDYLVDDLLFWNDMYFETFGNEWLYIEDENHNAVYIVNDYRFDCIDDLVKSGETVIPKSNMTYEEYREEERNLYL